MRPAAKEFISQMNTYFGSSRNRCIAFYGPMGIGKTTFIKAVCEEMQITDVATSPTFALVNEYHTENGVIIYHFDFFRIENREEVMAAGISDHFYEDNYSFIEWPEKVKSELPAQHLSVKMTETPDGQRRLFFDAKP